ncbi:NAD(P)-dependent oxidoreductase [soil metagenome]
MATLITGGCGFIGLSIAERLIADGEAVVLFDVAPPAGNIMARRELTGATVITGDIRNTTDIDRALAHDGIDRVIHTAAMTPNAARERDDPHGILAVNMLGTVNLVDRAAAMPAIKRVTVLSSVAVYGFSQPAPSGLLEEDLSPLAPLALYGISKVAAEQSALRIAQLRGIDVRVIRLGPVFGPWELPSAVRDALSPHHQILAMAHDGVEAILPRSMAGDWIYSRDAAEGIARISNGTALRHSVYNVSGGVMTDVPQWCAIVAKRFEGFRWKLGSEGDGNIVYGLLKDRAALSIARLGEDTGFQPSRTLEAAASDYLGWIAAGAGA